jgi:hypothetical protein
MAVCDRDHSKGGHRQVILLVTSYQYTSCTKLKDTEILSNHSKRSMCQGDKHHMPVFLRSVYVRFLTFEYAVASISTLGHQRKL